MDFVLFRVAILLAGSACLAWQDAKTSFMDEKLLYALCGIGILLNIASFNPQFIFYSLGVAAIIFGVGYVAYKKGAVGGGDVLLVTAIQLLLPQRPIELTQQFLSFIAPSASVFNGLVYTRVVQQIPFFLSVIITASVIGLVGSALMYAWQLKKKKLKPDFLGGAATAVAAGVALYFVATIGEFSVAKFIVLAIVFLSAVFLNAFRKQIFDECIVKEVTLSEVEDEDILAIEKIDKKTVSKFGLQKLLNKHGVERLKKFMEKEKLKTAPVAKVLPRFGPYLLIGVVLSILIGDALTYFMLFS